MPKRKPQAPRVRQNGKSAAFVRQGQKLLACASLRIHNDYVGHGLRQMIDRPISANAMKRYWVSHM